MKNALIKAGFKSNVHCDAYDRGDYRVYFDDNLVIVIKFNNPKSQIIEWRSSVDMGMGEDKSMLVIEAMTK